MLNVVIGGLLCAAGSEGRAVRQNFKELDAFVDLTARNKHKYDTLVQGPFRPLVCTASGNIRLEA